MRGRLLRSSKHPPLRPTTEKVRSAIFSIIGQEEANGARVLDVYAGTGSLGIEAMSRGASWCDFIESNLKRSQQIQQTLREMKIADRTRVYNANVDRVADLVSGPYDLVFADPPYDFDPWNRLMQYLNTENTLHDKSLVIAEHSSEKNLSKYYGPLSLITRRRYGDTSISIYKPGLRND